jgi:hypothetical protein
MDVFIAALVGFGTLLVSVLALGGLYYFWWWQAEGEPDAALRAFWLTCLTIAFLVVVLTLSLIIGCAITGTPQPEWFRNN